MSVTRQGPGRGDLAPDSRRMTDPIVAEMVDSVNKYAPSTTLDEMAAAA